MITWSSKVSLNRLSAFALVLNSCPCSERLIKKSFNTRLSVLTAKLRSLLRILPIAIERRHSPAMHLGSRPMVPTGLQIVVASRLPASLLHAKHIMSPSTRCQSASPEYSAAARQAAIASTSAPSQVKQSSKGAASRSSFKQEQPHRARKSGRQRSTPEKHQKSKREKGNLLHTEAAVAAEEVAAQDTIKPRSASQSLKVFQEHHSRPGAAAISKAAVTQVPRKPGVTGGAWDAHDARAVEEALNDELTSSRRTGAEMSLLGKTAEELEQLAIAEGFPAYRGKQLYDGIMHGARSIHDIRNIPAGMKEALASKGYKTGRSVLQHKVVAKDGTCKLLLQLHDGRVIEAVGIPNEKDSRLTACVSSQVGCPMRCTFCATGKGGFARNLKPHEIVDQVLTIQEHFGTRVSNVVFMGMGEPLLNIRSMLGANQFLTSEVGIGARHITISSVGVPNAIMKLASHKLQNTLAISIHAPTQELRERIVPSARVYPLEALMMDCNKYFQVTSRRITFEYTLLAGVNDSVAQAKQLASLLQRFDLRAHVNLIPWNPISQDSSEVQFQRPTRAAVAAFTAALDSAGITNSVRATRGMEAAAACGQLRNQFQKTPLGEFAALT